jgi:hypothetical protein
VRSPGGWFSLTSHPAILKAKTMTNIPHVLGQGDCHRCNKLATDLEDLRRDYLTLEASLTQIVQKIEADAINWMIERGRMQDTIDQLRAEKNDPLCRCEGWDTSVIGNQQ